MSGVFHIIVDKSKNHKNIKERYCASIGAGSMMGAVETKWVAPPTKQKPQQNKINTKAPEESAGLVPLWNISNGIYLKIVG